MVLSRKKVVCPLQVGGEILPKVEEFKYLGVLFTTEGDWQIDQCSNAVDVPVCRVEEGLPVNLRSYSHVWS